MAEVVAGYRPGIANLEKAWGVDPHLVAVAEWSGMDAIDLETLREFSLSRRFLMVFRAPGGAGRAIRALGADVRPKPAEMKEKTQGKWITRGNVFYTSDWDLLSVWRRDGAGYSKFALPASGAQLDNFLKDVNRQMLYPLQHGANDDYLDAAGQPKNRDIGTRFVTISDVGRVDTCETLALMKAFYAARGLTPWLYD